MRNLSIALGAVSYLLPLLLVLLFLQVPILFSEGSFGTKLLIAVVALSSFLSAFAFGFGRQAYLALPTPRPTLRKIELLVAGLPFVVSVGLLLALGLGVTA